MYVYNYTCINILLPDECIISYQTVLKHLGLHFTFLYGVYYNIIFESLICKYQDYRIEVFVELYIGIQWGPHAFALNTNLKLYYVWIKYGN